jgi:hypothetical protein
MPTSLQIKGRLKFYSMPLGRQWKWRYQVHGRMAEPKLVLPPALEAVKYTDPLREWLDARKSLKDKTSALKENWLPPRRHPNLEFLFPKLTLADRADFNRDQPVKLIDRSTRLHAGIKQACLLTKVSDGFTLCYR